MLLLYTSVIGRWGVGTQRERGRSLSLQTVGVNNYYCKNGLIRDIKHINKYIG